MRVGVVALWGVVAFGMLGCFAPPPGGGGGNGDGGAGGGGAGGGGSDGGAIEGTLMFGPQTALPAVSGHVVVTGDVNGDGKSDLVVAGNGPSGNGGNALVGSGNASFTTGATFVLPVAATWLALGDRDGDGHADLVATLGAGSGTGNLALLAGNGSGGFGMPSFVVGEPNPVAVITGDFDGDGKADAATVNAASPSLGASVFYAARPTTHDNYTVGASPHIIVSGDWNGDGRRDLAVGGGDATAGTVTLLVGRSDGTFNPLGMVTFARAILALGAGDFDADGKLDIVVGTGGGDVIVGLGNGDGTFTLGPTTHALAGSAAGAVLHLEVADFNGGGRADVATLVVPTAGQAYLGVLLGNGNGSLQAPLTYGAFDPSGLGPESLTSGDYDSDGRRDLAVAHGNIDLFLNRSR